MFVQSTKKCDWEEYWEQEEVEARLKEKGWLLDSYIRNRKKKAHEMAKFICESRARNPDKFGIIGESVYGRRLTTRMKH
jgi:hypothetical protein